MKRYRNRVSGVHRRKGNHPDPVMKAAAQDRRDVLRDVRLSELEADAPREVSGQLLMFTDWPPVAKPKE